MPRFRRELEKHPCYSPDMKLKVTVFFLVLGMVQVNCGAASGQPLAATRPNVLFVCVDDLKPVLGCYGDRNTKSPYLDRLAARGMLFERAYCNQAVCAPSRNSLLTGQRSTTTGIYDLGTSFREATPDSVTLPQLFKQNGYVSLRTGKIFHGGIDDAVSWTEGGDAAPPRRGR